MASGLATSRFSTAMRLSAVICTMSVRITLDSTENSGLLYVISTNTVITATKLVAPDGQARHGARHAELGWKDMSITQGHPTATS